MSKELEEGKQLQLDFTKLAKAAACGQDILPVVAQDADSKEVLILGYANALALAEAQKRGVAVFWSTSRNELWIKGLTSGDVLKLVEIRVNCEQNSLLYLVRPQGKGACHTKDQQGNTRSGCYYRKIQGEGLEFVATP